MGNEMKNLADEVATLIMDRLQPEIHNAMIEKIIESSLENWRSYWRTNEKITESIDRGIQKAMDEKYKMILDYIANKKAREQILQRAEKNKIPLTELESLFKQADEEK